MDPDFVQCYFDQDARLNNYLHPLVNKGAKNDMKVSAGNAITGDVCFPEYEEQRLIAMLFDRLDNLITFHHRKRGSVKCKYSGHELVITNLVDQSNSRDSK